MPKRWSGKSHDWYIAKINKLTEQLIMEINADYYLTWHMLIYPNCFLSLDVVCIVRGYSASMLALAVPVAVILTIRFKSNDY